MLKGAVIITDEMREKARATRAAKVAARRESALKGRADFSSADVLNWEKLASARDLTLPPWGEPLTNRIVESWLRKVGVTVRQYLDWDGEGQATLGGFQRRNPEWPARAWAGLVLENLTAIRGGAPVEPEISLADWERHAKASGINTRLTATAGAR